MSITLQCHPQYVEERRQDGGKRGHSVSRTYESLIVERGVGRYLGGWGKQWLLLSTMTTQKPDSHGNNGISHMNDFAIGQGHRSSPAIENACRMHGPRHCGSSGSLAEGADGHDDDKGSGRGGRGGGWLFEAEGL